MFRQKLFRKAQNGKQLLMLLLNFRKNGRKLVLCHGNNRKDAGKDSAKHVIIFSTGKLNFLLLLILRMKIILKAKLAIIDELEKFEPGTDVQAAFERLKELQRKWTEIGFVPFNLKDEITNKYRTAINKEFDKLKIGDEDKSILKYKTKLDNLKANPKASRKVRNERDKFFTKIKQLESDIVLWENNIGFFAKSTNADTMIKEVEEKIESAKKLIKTLEEKVKMIDQSGLDD